jgi:hypothetical protein
MDYDSDTLTDSTYDNIHAINAAASRRYNDNLYVAESAARDANAALIGANTNDTTLTLPDFSHRAINAPRGREGRKTINMTHSTMMSSSEQLLE